MSNSPRIGLPYLDAAQAQKHVTMNEALARLDVVAAARVETDDVRSRSPSPIGSTRCSMARIQTGELPLLSQAARAVSPAAITMAAAPSVTGGSACARSGEATQGFEDTSPNRHVPKARTQ